jgi:hypothetical protein
VPISVLTQAPYNLPWGSSVFAIVQAFNSYGDSDFSVKGNGAIILTSPDAPIGLAINPAFVRTASTLSIVWSQGVRNGGSSVISYRVSFD